MTADVLPRHRFTAVGGLSGLPPAFGAKGGPSNAQSEGCAEIRAPSMPFGSPLMPIGAPLMHQKGVMVQLGRPSTYQFGEWIQLEAEPIPQKGVSMLKL
jgi:hypothetical protein